MAESSERVPFTERQRRQSGAVNQPVSEARSRSEHAGVRMGQTTRTGQAAPRTGQAVAPTRCRQTPTPRRRKMPQFAISITCSSPSPLRGPPGGGAQVAHPFESAARQPLSSGCLYRKTTRPTVMRLTPREGREGQITEDAAQAAAEALQARRAGRTTKMAALLSGPALSRGMRREGSLVSSLDALTPSNRIYSPKRDRRARTLASPHCFFVSDASPSEMSTPCSSVRMTY